MKKLSIMVMGFSLLLFATATVGAQPWYDADWAYRVPITVSNSSGVPLTDYQVLVTLDSSFNFSEAASDGSDIRITDWDGVTELSFWIEEWDTDVPSSETARVWVRVPSIPAEGSEIYLYYGNPSATSASDGTNTFIFFDSFEDFDAGGMNAPTYLTTPTYDGSGQVVHPDIVYVPGGWNGYEYWMVMTPYPNGNPSYENPSVIASHDGISWEVPTGLTNPLVGGGSNADPDFLLVDGEMVLYYMWADSTTTHVERITSTDGEDWAHDSAPVFTMPRYLLSPTVLYEGGTYSMWYVRNGGCTASSSDVYMRTSSNGTDWGSEASVNISLPGQVLWHLDIQKVGDKYVMVVASYPDTSDCGHTSLYYAESTDGMNWTEPALIIAPSISGWDSGEIYRASFLAEQVGDDIYLRIWYSADSSGGQWHVGYTEGYLDEFVSPPEPGWDLIDGNVSATTEYARSGMYSLKQVGGSSYPQVYKDMTGKFSVSAWLYDQADDVDFHLAVLRAQDPGNVTYPTNHMIGVGFYTGTSTSHYSYHTEGFSYIPTIIPRTSGWHKLTINVKETTCDLLIDDTVVASLDVLDEENIINFSLQGYRGGTSWFDDVYARQYVDPEPSTLVGEEEILPSAVSPAEGTIGTEFTITGSGFGDEQGYVIIGTHLCKVLEWSDSFIRARTKYLDLPPDVYDVEVRPQPWGTPSIVFEDAFTVMAPQIDSMGPTQACPGTRVTIYGWYFGTEKRKVYLQEWHVYLVEPNGTRIPCGVANWWMDRTTGESEIVFATPWHQAPGDYVVIVENRVGSAIQEGFTIEECQR